MEIARSKLGNVLKSTESRLTIRLLRAAWGPWWPCTNRKREKREREDKSGIIKRIGKWWRTKHWMETYGDKSCSNFKAQEAFAMRPGCRASIRCSASTAVCQRGISVRCSSQMLPEDLSSEALVVSAISVTRCNQHVSNFSESKNTHVVPLFVGKFMQNAISRPASTGVPDFDVPDLWIWRLCAGHFWYRRGHGDLHSWKTSGAEKGSRQEQTSRVNRVNREWTECMWKNDKDQRQSREICVETQWGSVSVAEKDGVRTWWKKKPWTSVLCSRLRHLTKPIFLTSYCRIPLDPLGCWWMFTTSSRWQKPHVMTQAVLGAGRGPAFRHGT